MFHSFPVQTRSISRDLTRILILILVLVACMAFSLSYLVSTRRAKRTLEQKADEYIVSLADILTIPLWMLDQATITFIGKTYMQNELITSLKIRSDDDALFFTMGKNSEQSEISRSKKVFYSDEFLGSVSFSLTASYYTTLNRQLF